MALLVAPSAVAATLQNSVDYGGNGAVMNLYVPDNVDEFPAVVVSLHYCTGNAGNAAGWFTSLSDQHGFLLIAPGLPPGDGDGCWDVGSSQTKTHDGGSHSKAIVEMVDYVIAEHGADPERVFVAGASSGAMLTNVLLGAYPDVFAAGSALAGVPFGCWTAADGWTGECADGNVVRSAAEWGDLVRNAYPGYSGPRPRVQLFHGTSDATLNYANLAEEIKQWTNVLELSETPTSTEENTPKQGWTRTNYEDGSGVVALEVSVGQGQGHDLTGQGLWDDVSRFFGLDVDVEPGAGEGGAAGEPGVGGTSGMGNGGSGTGAVGPVGGSADPGNPEGGNGGDSSPPAPTVSAPQPVPPSNPTTSGPAPTNMPPAPAPVDTPAPTGPNGVAGSTNGTGGTGGTATGSSGDTGAPVGAAGIPNGPPGVTPSPAPSSSSGGLNPVDSETSDAGGCRIQVNSQPGGSSWTLLLFVGLVARRWRR